MTTASFLLKVTVTVMLALGGARLARHSRASVRHLILAASFVVLMLLPFGPLVTPAIVVELPIAAERAAVLSSIDAVTFETPTEEPASSTRETTAPANGTPGSGATLSVATMIVGIWIAGAAIFFLPLAIGLGQTQSWRRSGLPWREGQHAVQSLAQEAGIRRRVEVLLHEAADGPMTCGVMRPVIVLPMAARSWPAADFNRAIVHEIEHIRRGDWLGLSAARAICAFYWFHPLVWVAHRRLALEAERACDDAVIGRSDAAAYADQLVDLARRLAGVRAQAALGMANRADLAARVFAVLDGRQRRGRAGAARVGLACLATFVLAMAISPLRFVSAAAAGEQEQAKFDVVSIKPCKSEPLPPTGPGARSAGPGNASISPGRAYWLCVTVDQLIQTAYSAPDIRLRNTLVRSGADGPRNVRGGPSWLSSDKFEIEAKAAGAADGRTMSGPMLRALLEDRFRLKTHRETEERSMYALTVAPGGPKIRQTSPSDCQAYDPNREPVQGDKPNCGSMHMSWNGGNRTLTSTGTTLQSYTDGILSPMMDRFVINRTGLEGSWNIPLEFAPDDNTPGGLSALAWARREGAEKPTAPTIFKALEQLGLKLESVKAPAEYFVIDHVEKPSGDRIGGQR